MRPVTALLLLAVSLSAAEKQVIVPANAAKPVGPYSPGIFAGDFLYVSGQGVRGPDGVAPTTPEAQVRQSLENCKAIVTAAGLTMEHVVYAQVYLYRSVGMDVVNRVWKEYFPANPPARATLGMFKMPTDTPVEITVVAIRDLSRKKAIGTTAGPAGPQAVAAGDRVYLSGFAGKDPKTGKAPEDQSAQVQMAFDQMKQALGAAGLDFRHLVFVNPYLTAKMPASVMNKVYASHFERGNAPARATIVVDHLPEGGEVEFTGVAVRDLSKRRIVRPKNMAPSATSSPCVFADDTFYCSAKSGFIPGPNGGVFADNVEDQVRQSMRNLLDGLEEADLNFSHVVASNVYVDNMDEFPKMNAVYGRYFPANAPPTRTTVSPHAPVERKRGNNGTFPALEEISIIAVK